MKLAKAISPKFKELMIKLINAEVPMKTAVKIKKVSEFLDEKLTNYETARVDLIKKYADLDENGDIIVDSDNNATFSSQESRIEFAKELSELVSVDLEIKKIPIEELGDNISLSTTDLIILEDIIDF